MNDVARLVVHIGGFGFGWIGMAERNRARSVRVAAAAGPSAPSLLPLDVAWDESPLGNGTVGAAIRTGTPQVNRDTECNPALTPWRDALLHCGLRSSVALPLTNHEGTFGTLALYSVDLDAFDEAEVRLLQDLANDLAYGITNLRTAADKAASADRLRGVMESTVEVIAATLEARDPYTAGHQRRVALLAAEISRLMGCDEPTIRGVHFGALIHDIGKIQIPSELLSKPTRLSELESRLLETHTEAGFDILRGIEFPWPVAQMVLQHHERLDGSGYPRGLTDDLILKEARILAVADVVEAMSSHRPYRPARGIDVALAEIERGRGTLYDSAAVDACLSLFREQGFTLPAAG
jgi:putative nucleotidyltransferase with HDIG domain